MAQNTNISWTHATWNVAVGCDKVSEGCEFCYMMREGEWRGQQREGNVVRTKTVFTNPLKWAKRTKVLNEKFYKGNGTLTVKEAEELHHLNRMRLIFCSSLTDVYHEAIDSYRNEVYDIIKQTPQYNYQILTKRIERVTPLLPPDWGMGYDNVWLGVTAENQARLLERGQLLCETHAKTRFLSIEPMLEEMDLRPLFDSYYKGIDWVIVGGESGFEPPSKWRYRKARLEWFEKIVAQCREYGVPVFVKQMGTWLHKEMKLTGDNAGADINQFPDSLKVRQFPKKYVPGTHE